MLSNTRQIQTEEEEKPIAKLNPKSYSYYDTSDIHQTYHNFQYHYQLLVPVRQLTQHLK